MPDPELADDPDRLARPHGEADATHRLIRLGADAELGPQRPHMEQRPLPGPHPHVGCGGIRRSVERRDVGGGADPGEPAGPQPRVERVAHAVADQVHPYRDQQDGDARHRRDVGRHVDQAARVAEHPAEIRLGRLRPEAEEAEACRLQDHPADRRGRGDGDHRQHVGEQLGRDDARVRLAGEPRRGDEIGSSQAHRRTAYGAGEEGHVHDHDGDHGVPEARPKCCHDRERQQQVGKRHQHVDAAHQQRVRDAAVVGGEYPDGGADHRREHRGGDADGEAEARPPDDPREQVAPQLVRAERMTRREESGEAVQDVGVVRIGQRQHGREQGDEGDQADEYCAERGDRVAPEPASERAAHAPLILGSSSPWARSVRRLMTT